MKTALIATLLFCANLGAFTVEPGVKQGRLVLYSCPPDLDAAFVAAFEKWNTALGGYFTLEAASGSVNIQVERGVIDPFLAFTNADGNWAGIVIDPSVSAEQIPLVLIHELGHALGLGHSDTGLSIMWPVLAGQPAELGMDDIRGIRFMYLKPKAPRKTWRPVPSRGLIK